MEKRFLTAGIIITVFTAFAFSQHKSSAIKNSAALQLPVITENKRDTVPQTTNKKDESVYTINSTAHGKQYKLVEVNGKVTELYVDNVKIPPDKIGDYSDVINELEKNFAMAKDQSESAKAQRAALEAQQSLILADKLALDSQAKANVLNMQQQATKLQEAIASTKMEKDSDQMQYQMEAIKSKAQLLQLKALAMSNAKNELSITQLEALEAAKAETQKDLILQLQAEKLAASKNETDVLTAQEEKLAVIAKEQALIQEQNEKQSKAIKEKTENIINEELKQQIQELKQQNEQLKQQLHQKDSLHVTPALSQGA